MTPKIVKIHKLSDNRVMLAICDSNLLGKKFENGKLQLDLSSDFYRGKEMDEEKILSYIDRTYIINLVGEESIDFGIRHNLIEKNNVVVIKKIPHAQAILI
ncbi:DUF424 family protein [Candidatus Woesearchaeota archaeon]|nr:DUF424 family protein [Candidatus Woesearchaeota archaeon]